MYSRIYLIGFMGVGKTTLGKKLAMRLDYRFIDLDDFFEEKYKIDIPHFFEKYGEQLFRELENERLKETFLMKKVVVATGGGTPCHYGGIEAINENGLSVFMEMPSRALADRLLHAKRKRPLVSGKKGEELIQYIENKLKERINCYRKAMLTFDVLQDSVDSLIRRIKKVE